MLAGEVKLPRRYLKNAFKVTYVRFAIFFIGSALCVGIVIPYNETTLLDIMAGKSGGAGTAAASPYVIAMRNLGITGLPHLTNALLCTSIFSAGNAYTYYGSRSLYSLALEGHAPKFLRKCTKAGVPMYCLMVTSLFPFLGFLNVSSGSAKVLTWFTNIITAAQIIDYSKNNLLYICSLLTLHQLSSALLTSSFTVRARHKDLIVVPCLTSHDSSHGAHGLR